MNEFEAYRVNGTPADCVALCAYHWDKVDILRLGLNLGENLGHFVWHYRTLAAAKQAALLGIRDFTLRTCTRKREPDFTKLKPSVQETWTRSCENHDYFWSMLISRQSRQDFAGLASR